MAPLRLIRPFTCIGGPVKANAGINGIPRRSRLSLTHKSEAAETDTRIDRSIGACLDACIQLIPADSLVPTRDSRRRRALTKSIPVSEFSLTIVRVPFSLPAQVGLGDVQTTGLMTPRVMVMRQDFRHEWMSTNPISLYPLVESNSPSTSDTPLEKKRVNKESESTPDFEFNWDIVQSKTDRLRPIMKHRSNCPEHVGLLKLWILYPSEKAPDSYIRFPTPSVSEATTR